VNEKLSVVTNSRIWRCWLALVSPCLVLAITLLSLWRYLCFHAARLEYAQRQGTIADTLVKRYKKISLKNLRFAEPRGVAATGSEPLKLVRSNSSSG